MKIRRFGLCAALLLFPALAEARTFFAASLTGGQNVPATPSAATAFARIDLNSRETGAVISFYYSGFIGGVTVAHIHAGVPGLEGPVVFTLSPTPGTTFGSVIGADLALTPTSLNQLKSNVLYIDIHTNSFPDGEIRGHFAPDPVLSTTMSGAQALPGNASTAHGRAFISLNAAETQMLVMMVWSQLGSNTASVGLYAGRPGTSGALVCEIPPPPIVGTSGVVRDWLCALTPAEALQLKTGGMYLEVRSVNVPGGEIRGQIKRTFSPCDFDGDSRADQVIVRNAGGNLQWWIRQSSGGMQTFTWGASEDFNGGVPQRMICPDIDGDGKADATIFRAGTFWTRLSGGGIRAQAWGETGDNPKLVGDYDGDGRDDYTVFRQGTPSRYWILESTTGNVRNEVWGSGDQESPQALPDYDGDGLTDFGIQQGGTFWRKLSADPEFDHVFWGLDSDVHHSADFDGDGKTDVAVTRTATPPPDRRWFIRSSVTGEQWEPFGNGYFFGTNGQVRVAADYDGDRRSDVAVWTFFTGVWWIQSVSTGLTAVTWGANGDSVVNSAYWH